MSVREPDVNLMLEVVRDRFFNDYFSHRCPKPVQPRLILRHRHFLHYRNLLGRPKLIRMFGSARARARAGRTAVRQEKGTANKGTTTAGRRRRPVFAGQEGKDPRQGPAPRSRNFEK